MTLHVCLVVPALGGHADHVAEAVRAHDDAELLAVWAGDPHLRPAPPARARWIDHALEEPSLAGWGRLLVTLEPEAYAFARGAAAVARHLDAGAPGVVVLHVGAVGILGSLAGWATGRGVTVAESGARTPRPDGLAPGPAELARTGPRSTAVYAAGPDAADALRSVAASVAGSPAGDRGGVAFEAALGASGVAVHATGHVHLAGVGTVPDGAVPVLDTSHLEADRPWRVRTDGRPARVRVSHEPQLAAWLEATADQWAEVDRTVCLPGGVRVDATIRALANEAIDGWRRGDGDLPPDPFGSTPGAPTFVEWLETPWPAWGADLGRYWTRLHAERRDLAAAFPQPARGDRARFAAWAATSWRHEPRSRLLRPTSRPLRPPWHDVACEAGGVNLIGYHAFDNSLGDVVRRLRAALDASGVPVAPVHYHRSGSPAVTPAPAGLTDELRYDTNVLVLNADQMPNVDADHGDVLWPGRRSIGYWFWDVEHVPAHVVEAMRHLDEIWVATPFTAAALQAVTRTPVRVVEIPVPEPSPGPQTRAELGLPDDRFVFLTTFDHLSVTERKNPIGAIDAFRRAFPDPSADGPMLVVKSLNASHRWVEHERVRQAAGFRPDIAVIDRHLDRGAQLALVAHADCLVSLHRSEGLGLHLIEAMWLGTPTIATRYSGNVHVADDGCALLVDAVLIPVERGEDYFPPEAIWADPDLDQAAAAMQRLVDDAGLRARLAEAGRARMQQQPSPAEAGARIASVLASVPAPSRERTAT